MYDKQASGFEHPNVRTDGNSRRDSHLSGRRIAVGCRFADYDYDYDYGHDDDHASGAVECRFDPTR